MRGVAIVTETKYGKLTLKQLAEVSGIKYGNLKVRYGNGKRGEELIKPAYGKAFNMPASDYGMTYKEIANELGISKSRVEELCKSAILKIKNSGIEQIYADSM